MRAIITNSGLMAVHDPWDDYRRESFDHYNRYKKLMREIEVTKGNLPKKVTKHEVYGNPFLAKQQYNNR